VPVSGSPPTSDGVRLWVTGQQLVNRWVIQGAAEVSGTIALAVNTAYAIQMEYYDSAGSALAQLSWSSAHQAKQIIPQAQLVPAKAAPPPPPPPPVQFSVKINFEPSGTAVPAGYCHFHAGGKWELAVPNGTYKVLVSVGDPSFASTFTINVEGVSYWNAAALGVNKFLSATKTADMATRIDYVEISQ
jgi:hypothetical protein